MNPIRAVEIATKGLTFCCRILGSLDRQKIYLQGLSKNPLIKTVLGYYTKNDTLLPFSDERCGQCNTRSDLPLHNSVTEAAFIDREWQNAAFNEALRRLQEGVRPDHFAAFVESTVEGIDTATVMRLHGMSRDNLYQIRARFTAKLKTLVETIRTEMDIGS